MIRPDKGDYAPSLSLPAIPDGPVDIGRPQGLAHVLFFYPRDNTPGCTSEAVAFTALQPEFADLGIAIIGVSKDSLISHERFASRHKLAVMLASDTDTDACTRFGVWTEKNMYGKKYMGIERSTFLIRADGGIEQVWRKVRVRGHAEHVLEAARMIMDTRS